MTPKEKARELVNERFYQPITLYLNVNNNSQQMWDYAKICALVCCNEIMGLVPNPMNPLEDKDFDYWQEVKNEIGNL